MTVVVLLQQDKSKARNQQWVLRMIEYFNAERFKSMEDIGQVRLAPFTVLFGTNAAGKSNFLDAVQVLSRLASERTLAEALGGPIRGLAHEFFMLPPEGLPGLLSSETSIFSLGATIGTSNCEHMKYSVTVAIRPTSGSLTVEDEYLANLSESLDSKGEPIIERVEESLRIRRKGGGGSRPREEKVGLGYTLLSDERLSGQGYRGVEKARAEMSSWRTYYLDPRVAMRSPQSPREVNDIGPLGEHVAPFLYRLREEHPKDFAAVRRTLRSLIPSIEDMSVDLDKRRGVLDVEITQGGIPFSSRVVSEGTLRVLALACVATNPWGGSVVAFEEPENGVHPRRIELIAQMLISMANQPGDRRQVIVTTHSPVFCGAVIRHARKRDEQASSEGPQIALYHVAREGHHTTIREFDPIGPLFDDSEVSQALSAASEDDIFEGLVMRGLLDD